MIHILLLFSFLLSSADLKATQVPAGYQFQVAEEVIGDDFEYSGLNMAGNFSDICKIAINLASVDQFPGLISLGISMARVDLSEGGVIPMHNHRGASENLLVTKGSISAGFISTNDILFGKTLNQGDIMVFPRGLLHFLVNSGLEPAVLRSSFSSSEPSLQVVSDALCHNILPSELIAKLPVLDDDVMKRLKALFIGSGQSYFSTAKDFCVADLKATQVPGGYQCKVTALLNDDEVKRLKALFGGIGPSCFIASSLIFMEKRLVMQIFPESRRATVLLSLFLQITFINSGN